MKTLALSLFLLIATTATASAAEEIKLCFRLYAAYLDNGYSVGGDTEDYWNLDNYRDVRGADVTIRRGSPSGTTVFSGNLGDGLGTGDPGKACTVTLSLTDVDVTYYIWIYSDDAAINGNTLDVVNGTGSSEAVYFSWTNSSGPGTYVIQTTGGDDVFRTFNAAALSIWRHGGGMSGKTFNVEVGGTSNTRYDGTAALISTNRSEYKYVIAHEMGHHLFDLKAPSNFENDCTFVASECPAAAGSHSFLSKEYSSCAHQEGFAQFFAADVWNDHGETDCVFKYYKNGNPTVDCEGTLTYANGYMKNNCNSPFAGRGGELDWLKQLWDVHTNGSSPPSFTSMMNWMRDADSWAFDEAYQELDAEAASIGGSLDANWDAMKNTNGINY